MKTVEFKPNERTTNVLLKVKDDVLEQKFKKAIGYQAKREFYMKYYINPSFINKYADKLDWSMLCRNQPLSNSTIDKYSNKVDWEEVSECQNLSDKIMWKYRDKISWFEASQYQVLSEEIISKLYDYVDWEFVSGIQKMSLEFMLKMRKRIKLHWLEQNPHLTEQDVVNYKILCKMTS